MSFAVVYDLGKGFKRFLGNKRKVKIFDLGSVLRGDVSKIGGFGVTFGNSAFYVIGRWYFFVRVAFQDHTFYHQGRGCTYQDQPQGELSKINKIKLLMITFFSFSCYRFDFLRRVAF